MTRDEEREDEDGGVMESTFDSSMSHMSWEGEEERAADGRAEEVGGVTKEVGAEEVGAEEVGAE